MLAIYDRVAAALAALAAWLFVATGAMLVYEVVARYLFVAPTIWAEELSRLFLVWGTFLGAAALLKNRQHIRITILTDRLSTRVQRVVEMFALSVVALLSAVASGYGAWIALDSLSRGRTTGSLLDLPMVVVEASVPTGFALLGLQAVIEVYRLAIGQTTPKGSGGDAH